MVSKTTFGIFIRTYYKDVQRLGFCLQSIERFCVDIDNIIVMCPESSVDAIMPVVRRFDFAELKTCPNYQNDFIGQQISKLRAHNFVPCDYIIHIDSDCVFNQKFAPSDLMRDKRPMLFHREYDFFYRTQSIMPWQSVTSQFLSQQVDLEFMALFPLIYPRRLYSDLEAWFEDAHRHTYENIEAYLSAPQLFSEFNLMGAFSYYRATGEAYHTHLNWGVTSPTHYVDQLAQNGQRDDRTIQPAEMEIIANSLGLYLQEKK